MSVLGNLRRVATLDLSREMKRLDTRPGGWTPGRRAATAVDDLMAEFETRVARGDLGDCIACLRGLTTRRGEFLETSVASELLEGGISPGDAVDAASRPRPPANPRTTMAASFFELLRAAGCDATSHREHARGLERGCYNHAIDRCIRSENSYEPAWSSPMFVSVYSGRCGLVLRNLEVGGLVSVATSPDGLPGAVSKLIRGDWTAADLGMRLTAAELCPQAGQKERDHIERRRGQKVVLKLSDMFTCPHCKARKHTQREVQIRGSDEASTTFCVCHECFGSFTVG